MNHDLYMRRCFQLAALGTGKVAPNPLVGAVVVHNNKIIGEGFHNKFGGPHAEVAALQNLTDPRVLENALLYVNLEPCSHTGKTPPCTEMIIAKGIRQVFISNRDPFDKVNGSGILKLREAGIHVTENVLEKEGTILNRRFMTFHKKKRPYIILKWAQTRNGYFAPPYTPSRGITWISNSTSQLLVHLWRSQEQSVLVGKSTVQTDNPRLSVRGITGNDPVRVVIDPHLSLGNDYHVFNNKAITYIFNYLKDEQEEKNLYVKIDETDDFITEMLKVLFKENIQSVLVEGGAHTIREFTKSSCWDEARVFTGQNDFESGLPAPLLNFMPVEQIDINGDLLSFFTNHSPA